MEFERVTFDLPHGTFHALQGGDPDGHPTGRAVELIGHDWGAFITYDACATAPERIERAVTLAIPHPLTFLSRLRLAQLRRSWYMGF
ncbi:hypothetical protein AB0M45_24370 [Nocardia sp. NPDC051787]|uniref:hypothetical protein n=1 Tax=Nocardia sp. NPDC051787 TaxID=3155415 RepID=UPI0034452943